MYEPQNLKRWEMPSNYFGEVWPDYYSSGVGQSRDSDCLEESNFAAMLKELSGDARMERQMMQLNNATEIKYWDGERYVAHCGVIVRSGAGWGAGPEYGILYRLTDGRYLGGVRHTDRGDLMTDVRYAATSVGALPDRWR